MKDNDLLPAILFPAIPLFSSTFIASFPIDLLAIRVSGVSINSVGVVSIDQSDHRRVFFSCVSATGI